MNQRSAVRWPAPHMLRRRGRGVKEGSGRGRDDDRANRRAGSCRDQAPSLGGRTAGEPPSHHPCRRTLAPSRPSRAGGSRPPPPAPPRPPHEQPHDGTVLAALQRARAADVARGQHLLDLLCRLVGERAVHVLVGRRGSTPSKARVQGAQGRYVQVNTADDGHRVALVTAPQRAPQSGGGMRLPCWPPTPSPRAAERVSVRALSSSGLVMAHSLRMALFTALCRHCAPGWPTVACPGKGQGVAGGGQGAQRGGVTCRTCIA